MNHLSSTEALAAVQQHEAERLKAMEAHQPAQAAATAAPPPRAKATHTLDEMVRAFVQGRCNAEGFATGTHAGVAAVIAPFSHARPAEEWQEDDGPVLWWRPPVMEPPYAGTPNDDDWPGYHTNWTPIFVPTTFETSPLLIDLLL